MSQWTCSRIHASNQSSVIVDRTAGSVLLTLLKTHSGSAVLDGSDDRIRSRTLMFGKNCDGHALSALTAVALAYCAFSLVFIHFCDHNVIHIRQLLVCLKKLHICYSDLSSLQAELVSDQHVPDVWRWWGPIRWLMSFIVTSNSGM